MTSASMPTRIQWARSTPPPSPSLNQPTRKPSTSRVRYATTSEGGSAVSVTVRFLRPPVTTAGPPVESPAPPSGRYALPPKPEGLPCVECQSKRRVNGRSVLYLERALDRPPLQPENVNLLYRTEGDIIIVEGKAVEQGRVISLPFGKNSFTVASRDPDLASPCALRPPRAGLAHASTRELLRLPGGPQPLVRVPSES